MWKTTYLSRENGRPRVGKRRKFRLSDNFYTCPPLGPNAERMRGSPDLELVSREQGKQGVVASRTSPSSQGERSPHRPIRVDVLSPLVFWLGNLTEEMVVCS
jgi:hypothetical protein